MKNIPPIVLSLLFLYPRGLSGQTTQPVPLPVPAINCNYAGTWRHGPFIGQSNDTGGNTIFLCFGDSIFIDHNGDQLIQCPDAPFPGVGYAFYQCPPTVRCSPLEAATKEPCFWPETSVGYWVMGFPTGDTWFFNNGALINSAIFGNGGPVKITFAPIATGDIFGGDNSCTDANPDAAFSIVFLTSTRAVGVSAAYYDDCIGKFSLRGGLPQWDTSQAYAVDITKVGNSAVKGLPHGPAGQWKHASSVLFSVPETGTYEVTIRDGKSCTHSFQIDMTGCMPSDNLIWSLPSVSALPGETVCLPLTIKNGEFWSASLSVSWDPQVLTFVDAVKKPHQPPQDFMMALQVKSNEGKLGLAFGNNAPIPIGLELPDGDTLVELCFNVTGPLHSFSPVEINSSLFPIVADRINGTSAVSVQNGKVEVKEPQVIPKPELGFIVRLAPNVISVGTSTTLLTQLPDSDELTVRIADITGRILLEQWVMAGAGADRLEIPTGQLPGGLYFVLCMDEMGQVAPPQALMIQGQASGF